MATKREKFAGCLIGQAVGDAMGFIVEGHGPSSCASFVELTLEPRKLIGQSRGPFSIGQYSDDTQLARELILSFLKCGHFNPADYAQRIATLFTSNRVVGRGLATQEAAYRIAAGIPWDKAGTPAPAAGNGSAMRAAPVGLLFAHNHPLMARVAHDQGRITHGDPRCSAGAVAIAGATAIVLHDSNIDAPSLCARLASWVYPFDTVLASALADLPTWISMPPQTAVKLIRRVGVQPGYLDNWQGISPFVTVSVLWSLYSFLKSPDDYWTAITTAIAAGGDVDTTAAMTGAIAGTRVGLTGIPAEAALLLTDQGNWVYNDLVGLADDLHALHQTISGNSFKTDKN